MSSRLEDLRTNERHRRLVTGIAVAVGLVLGWIHWAGFVVGGALVAVPQASLRRGLLAGLGFGVCSLLAFVAWLATVGAFDAYVAMGQVRVVSAVIPLAAALFGSLIRGLR